MFEKYDYNDVVKRAYEHSRAVFEELHKCPELGNMEYNTAQMIENNLQVFGLETERILNTTVISGQNNNGKIKIAIRADIDAIKISEETNLSYKSTNPGVMHACGHDAHTAILLGFAKVCSEIKDFLPEVDLIHIFQQDEEGDGKGKYISESGILDDCDLVIGFHVSPELNAGITGVKRGLVCGASKMFDIRVLGKKSHGAKPHLGCDAILAASSIISVASSVLTRITDPAKSALISFGMIEGGNARNIICDDVRISGIIRGESEALCIEIADELEAVSQAVSAAYGCICDIKISDGYPELINDEELCDVFLMLESENNEQDYKYKNEHLQTLELSDSSLMVDDFAFYGKKAQSIYFYIGSGYEGRENSPLHTGKFEINPECLKTGIETLLRLVYRITEIKAKK